MNKFCKIFLNVLSVFGFILFISSCDQIKKKQSNESGDLRVGPSASPGSTPTPIPGTSATPSPDPSGKIYTAPSGSKWTVGPQTEFSGQDAHNPFAPFRHVCSAESSPTCYNCLNLAVDNAKLTISTDPPSTCLKP